MTAEQFKKLLVGDSEVVIDGSNILESLQQLFFLLENNTEAVDTKLLTRSFGWSAYELFMQHDVQELNRQLCDKLESWLSKNNSRVNKAPNGHINDSNLVKGLFMGKYKSYIKCINVEFESSRLEEYYDLQLDVKGCKDVYESFEKFISTDRLEGENQYEADGYGKQDAEKGISFSTFPKVLNLHLKRFQYNVKCS